MQPDGSGLHSVRRRRLITPVLRDGLFFARDGGEALVLDIVEDRYLALNAEQANLWSLARGEGADAVLAAALDPALAPVIAAWTRMGLLVPPADRSRPVPRAKPALAPATRDLPGAPAMHSSMLAPFRFAVLRRAMRVRVRMRGLAGALSDVCADRPDASSTSDVSAEAVRALVPAGTSAFRDDCLPRSLAAARLLWRRGWPADLCFGAQKFPFQAHAWVEIGGMAVTDVAARLQRFRVIARF